MLFAFFSSPLPSMLVKVWGGCCILLSGRNVQHCFDPLSSLPISLPLFTYKNFSYLSFCCFLIIHHFQPTLRVFFPITDASFTIITYDPERSFCCVLLTLGYSFKTLLWNTLFAWLNDANTLHEVIRFLWLWPNARESQHARRKNLFEGL